MLCNRIIEEAFGPHAPSIYFVGDNNCVPLCGKYKRSRRIMEKQLRSNKDGSEGRDEDFNCRKTLFPVFFLQILCRRIAGCLQVISRFFADREPYLDLPSDSMPLALRFAVQKETYHGQTDRRTDGRTDG